MTIMERLYDHYEEALQCFPEDRVVGIFLQGSQNYGLDTMYSDVDTKLIVTPTFEDIAMNKKAVSTTHIRENDEHIDFKDIRLYIQTFRKQNLNFLEILFTKYAIVNPMYKDEWDRLVEAREAIARYAPLQAIRSMKGIAMEKYHAMEHHYPARMAWINKFGYDPKQLHHLLRVNEYINRYIDGESYEECLQSQMPEYLQKVKLGFHNLDDARVIADDTIECINKMCTKYLADYPTEVDANVDALLDDVQFSIMKIAIKKEIGD